MANDRTRFRSANDRIEQLASDPLIAEDVKRYADERTEANRLYLDGLAALRKAGKLTQQQLAERLQTDQGTVSRIEHRDDLLLSTLLQYLLAAGAQRPRIIMEHNGVEVELDLDTLNAAETTLTKP